MKKNNSTIMIILLLLLGCSKVKEEQVLKDFQERYPSEEVLQIGTGEGDADSVYYHIKYKHRKNDRTKEAIFLYQKKDSEWKFVLDAGK